MALKQISQIKANIAAFTKKANAVVLGDSTPDSIFDVTGVTAKKDPAASLDQQNMPSNGSNTNTTGETALPTSAGLTANGNAAVIAPSVPKEPLRTSGVEDLAKKASEALARITKFSQVVTAAPTAVTPAPEAAKTATASNGDANIELSRDFLCKLASALLSTEDGRKDVEASLERLQGVDAARRMVKDAMSGIDTVISAAAQEEEMHKRAAAEQDQTVAILRHQLNSASPEERNKIMKLAMAAEAASAKFESAEEHQALADGIEVGSAYVQDQEMRKAAAAAAGQPMPPEAGGADPAAGGADPDAQAAASPEAIMAIIQHLVQSGELKPEEAQEIMSALQGGGEQGGASAGGSPEAGQPSPEEQEAQQTAEKAASFAASLAL